jgi:hypothetical protein
MNFVLLKKSEIKNVHLMKLPPETDPFFFTIDAWLASQPKKVIITMTQIIINGTEMSIQ